MFLSNLSETILFGKDFSGKLIPNSILLLEGPVGSGKTSFVKGIAEGLCIKEEITSPTFALCHHYYSGKIPLAHIDLYRLKTRISAEELLMEEEEEIQQNGGIMIIEWPGLLLPVLKSYWLLKFDYGKDFGRNCKIFQPKDFKNS